MTISFISPSYGFLETFCPGIRNIGFTEFTCYLHLLNFLLQIIGLKIFFHRSLVEKFENLPVEGNCIPRTSGEGVEETLIVQFGQKWMKSTTDALQDKKEEDEDPSQVLLLSAFQIGPEIALKTQQSVIDNLFAHKLVYGASSVMQYNT